MSESDAEYVKRQYERQLCKVEGERHQLRTRLAQVEAERDAAVAHSLALAAGLQEWQGLHDNLAERLKVAVECLKSLQGLTVHREHEERIAAVLAQLAQEPAK